MSNGSYVLQNSNFDLFCIFRTAVEDHKTEPLKFDSQENGAATPPEGAPDCLDSTPEIGRGGSEIQKLLSEDPLPGSVENDRRIPNHLDVNGHGQEKDMKTALEHRAQLIGQYEEMEKAQREWEEKYRENNTSTPVCFINVCLCHGNLHATLGIGLFHAK